MQDEDGNKCYDVQDDGECLETARLLVNPQIFTCVSDCICFTPAVGMTSDAMLPIAKHGANNAMRNISKIILLLLWRRCRYQLCLMTAAQ